MKYYNPRASWVLKLLPAKDHDVPIPHYNPRASWVLKRKEQSTLSAAKYYNPRASWVLKPFSFIQILSLLSTTTHVHRGY